MTSAALTLTREQILAFRRALGSLDERLPPGAASLRRAAWAGLQDSMPRAALLSIHARVAGARPDTWADPVLVQVWGPRFSVFVVAAEDAALFTLGRYPDDARGRRVAEETAQRLSEVLAGSRMRDRDAADAMTGHPYHIRYSTTTGTVRIRWEGALAPTVWTVPRPDISPADARAELARRYLHVYGPTTPASFVTWAGISAGQARAAWSTLDTELLRVQTPIGEGWLLAEDEAALRATPIPPAPARLLPSGDAFYLLQGRDRELLVPDQARRGELWTSRVWPGALLVEGEVAGVWRRSNANLSVGTWRRFSAAERAAVEEEAAALPLGLERPIRVTWDD